MIKYLGDGVHAIFDGYQIWLETPRDGITHSVALEPKVFEALLKFKDGLAKPAKPSECVGCGMSWYNCLCTHEED